MKITKKLYVTTFDKWMDWLSKNYNKEKEIWLIYYRKSSGKKRISYNDAVNGALCYGWIDSTVKKIDEERFAQRFTPRRPKSNLSELNKERIRRLIEQNKMTPIGLKAIEYAFDSKQEEKFVVPKEILNRIKSNPEAWENFQKLPLGYKRVRIGYIQSQGKHGDELFEKSLNNFIKMTAKNKRFGFLKD